MFTKKGTSPLPRFNVFILFIFILFYLFIYLFIFFGGGASMCFCSYHNLSKVHRISLIRCHPQIIYRSHTIGSSKWNKHHPQIVAPASICKIWGARTSVLIIDVDANWSISRAVHDQRLASTTNSRTEKLCVLLAASIRSSCVTYMYLIQPSLPSASFLMK